jgi:hypothetical protein
VQREKQSPWLLLGTFALTISFSLINSALAGGRRFSRPISGTHLDFNARWIHDFDIRNAVEGDGFSFVASLKF